MTENDVEFVSDSVAPKGWTVVMQYQTKSGLWANSDIALSGQRYRLMAMHTVLDPSNRDPGGGQLVEARTSKFIPGLMVGALLAVLLSLLFYSRAFGKTPPMSTTGGRFQLVQLSDMRRDQFLIDTESGRIWESVCSGKATGADCDGVMLWREMLVEGLNWKAPSSSRK